MESLENAPNRTDATEDKDNPKDEATTSVQPGHGTTLMRTAHRLAGRRGRHTIASAAPHLRP
ncbi:hypothetical protein [Streptomyces sp. NPDC001743]|uniref:hypothetical protein n=1 Tax=Streptomyces sp. NPDC001743 TaxID=3154397 RepID=UPI0033327A67